MATKNIFTEHPTSIGETYWQHLWCALKFGAKMIWGGLACVVHALLPFFCVKTASRIIENLHGEMITHRHEQSKRRSSV